MSKFERNAYALLFKKIAIFSIVYIVCILTGSCVLSSLLYTETIPLNKLQYGVLIVLSVTSIALTSFMLRNIDERKVKYPVVSVIVSSLLLAIVGLIVNVDNISGFLPTMLVLTGGAFASYLLKGKKRSKYLKNTKY